MEIRDRLSNFKGPLALKDGANHHHWQMTDPNDTTMNRYAHAPLPGSKAVERWLLVQKNTPDPQLMLMLGLQLGCPVLLEKTFWVRKQSTDDQQVWKNFDMDNDYRFFEEPWARIDLYPGFVLSVS